MYRCEPLLKEPLLKEPLLNEPLLNEPLLNEPLLNESLLNEPLLNEPLLNEPLLNEPLLNEPQTNFNEPLLKLIKITYVRKVMNLHYLSWKYTNQQRSPPPVTPHPPSPPKLGSSLVRERNVRYFLIYSSVGLTQDPRRRPFRYFLALIDHLGTRTWDLLIRKPTPDRLAIPLHQVGEIGGRGQCGDRSAS